MKKTILATAFSIGLAGLAHAEDTQGDRAKKDQAKGQKHSQHAAKSAAAGDNTAAVLASLHAENQMEMQFGDLASTRAKSADLKEFGEKLYKDHIDADQKVKDLASKKGIDLKKVPPPSDPREAEHQQQQKQALTRLSGLSGDQFDQEFRKVMASGHQHTINTLNQAKSDTQDQDLERLLGELLPVLKEHRNIAQGERGNQMTGEGKKRSSQPAGEKDRAKQQPAPAE